MAKRGKKYKEATKLIDQERNYTIEEACDIVGKTSKVNFDASVDIDLRLGVDPRHADQMVRGSVSLPHGTGKEIRVLALVSEGKEEEAEDAGADYVGLNEYIEKIEEGWTDIDVVVANPEVMSKIGRLGRILGPRGLMPNPKSGTVTEDVAGAVNEAKSGKIDFRVDRQGNLHASIGRASFEPAELRENAVTFLQRVIKLRPASAKGLYVRNASLSTTMGPGIPLDRSSVMAA
jgi:large subunit ribosomal protein L1